MSKQKRWRVNSSSAEQVNSLFTALKIHPALCSILVQRGIDSFEKARDFFRPQLSSLNSPWLMKDMDKAVDRYTGCVCRRRKNISVWRLRCGWHNSRCLHVPVFKKEA